MVPLFPLSAHIFPGGRMALRIFEARYLRMVKEALREERGFGICMVNSKGDKALNQHIYPIGTYVEVVDFDMLEDGLLGLTVEGRYLFNIDHIDTESDGLRVGQCNKLTTWNNDTFIGRDDDIMLSSRLNQIIENYPELSTMYDAPELDNLSWVVYRWLELLPIKASDKQQLLGENEPGKVLTFLEELVK